MEKLPKVSVVLITYNQQDFVAEAIESVLNQTYKSIEIIIADDGSKDGTPAIIAKYAGEYPIIKPILARENRGIAHNVNRALKLVEGEYVALLAGDDLMLPCKIEKQVDYLTTNLDVIACAHDMEVFNSLTMEILGRFSEVISLKKIKGKIGVEFLFDPTIYLCPSAMMYRKEYIPEHGYDVRLRYANDYLFDIEVFSRGKLGYIDEVIGKYRRHSRNVTGSSDLKKIGFEELLITWSIVMARYPELYKLVKNRRTAAYFSEIIKSIKKGDKIRAKNLSKTIISEGCYIKGLFAYVLSQILSESLVNNIYEKSKYKKKLRELWMKIV